MNLWPVEIPIMTAETINSSVWFTMHNVFQHDILIQQVISQYAIAGHYIRPLNKGQQFKPSHSPAQRHHPSNTRKAHLFNIAVSLLGYTEGQDHQVLIDTEYIKERLQHAVETKKRSNITR
jgi:hypothetical protein